jgi:hypothetical protein
MMQLEGLRALKKKINGGIWSCSSLKYVQHVRVAAVRRIMFST